MFGVEGTSSLHFATNAKMIGGGLDEQLEKFVREHSDTKLIIVDTLQKVREAANDSYSYSSDYEVIGKLKQFAEMCIRDRAWGETSSTWAKAAVRSAFGVLDPVSYCARRTSADFSGKPSAMPRYFCVIPRKRRKK